MKLGSRLPSWLKNKYFIVTAVFLLYIIVLDNRNIFNQMQYRSELNDLENKHQALTAEKEFLIKETKTLQKDKNVLEKIAREKYYMKRSNETLFLFDDETLKK
jgi:cell division protein FtsB